MFLAIETQRMNIVEYAVSSQSINRLRAYYASKAGLKIGLLRVLLYKQALHSLANIDKEQLKANKQYLDLIWQMPFSWPPDIPTDLSAVTKGEINKINKESFMQGQYVVTIDTEGSKIDLNSINHPIESIAKATREQILSIFNNKVEGDEAFGEKYRNTNFEELVFHLVDWVDEDRDSLNGGDESSYYSNYDSDFIPPNEPFKTIEELRLVEGMNEELYTLLKQKITVYGVSGININHAQADILKSIDPQITDEISKSIIEYRNGSETPEQGPFKDEKDFLDYLSTEFSINTEESTFNTQKIPLFFETEFNFRIKSYGMYSNVSREIEVVTFDFENLKGHLAEAFKKQDASSKPAGSGPKPTPTTTGSNATTKPKAPQKDEKTSPAPTGRPHIVYWEET